MRSLQLKSPLLWIALLPLSLFSMNMADMYPAEGLPLFWWGEDPEINFGDYISLKIVERMVEGPIRYYRKKPKTKEKKLLALGSIFYFANDNDVIWGSGINGKTLDKKHYSFNALDVRAVRGPLTRRFLMENFGIECPRIYGDPALLFPYLFPEFHRQRYPSREYIVIPHYRELKQFPKSEYPSAVYPTEPWNEVVEKILDSKFVISSSLHGIIIAEAYGIPARYLRIKDGENLFKYQDYYEGTGRPNFQYAESIEEALRMGGEPPFTCDLQSLYDSFPFEFWPSASLKFPKFQTQGCR